MILQFNFEELLSVEIKLTFSIMILLLLALSISLLIRALRWYFLMRNQHTKLSLSISIKLLLVGNALNIILPAGLGDIVKSYFGYVWSGMKERMIAVSISDKLIAIGSLFFISVFSYVFDKDLLIFLIGNICLIPLLILLFSRHLFIKRFIERIFNKIKLSKIFKISFSELVDNFDFTFKKLTYSILLSIAAWCITYYLLFLCFKAVVINITFAQVLVYAPVLTLIRLFPLTLNGIGSDEAAIIYIFSKFESNSQNILIGALIYRFVLMVIPAIIGVFVMLTTKNSKNLQN